MCSSIVRNPTENTATAERSRQPSDRRLINWRRYVIASLTVGVAFVLLDMLANANPLAEQAYAVFAPIVRPGIDIVPAIAIDLAYGFALSAIFLVLYPSLPGEGPFSKGLSFGLLVWFLRVVMSAAGQWVLFAIPLTTVTYTIASGLVEMLVLGALLGIVTRSVNEDFRQTAASNSRG
jgi:hypothetical protein